MLTKLPALTLAFAVLATAAPAQERGVLLSRHEAEKRVAQLSPGSGVVPGYDRQRLSEPYRPGQIVFEGNIPVAVIDKNGNARSLGAYGRAQQYNRAVPVERAAPPRHAVIGVTREPAVARAVAPSRQMDPIYLPQTVVYETRHPVGTIVIDTRQKFLYHVTGRGEARRYGVGVGKEGFSWRGSETITRKAEWPGWTPPKQMIARERAKGRILPAHMPGGPENPLGARALYLGSTLYRIHGTNQPWTIGTSASSGCIRMRNEDVIELYEATRVGARVVVL